MNHHCDGCGKPIKSVGKLFKVGYMMLCKECRMDHRIGKMGLNPNKRRTKRKK